MHKVLKIIKCYELKYPEDWGSNKKFGENDVILYSRKHFEFSLVFLEIFERLVKYLRVNEYFEE